MAWPLRRSHHHIYVFGWHNLAKVDVKSVRKGQDVSCFQVGADMLLVDVALDFIGQQNHDEVGSFGSIGYRLDRQSFGFSFLDGATALVQTHDYVDTAVFEIERMRVALRTVANDGHRFTI